MIVEGIFRTVVDVDLDTKRRAICYAIFITLAQLLQMLAGMFVTIKAVMYQNAGQACNVNRTNSVLGLTMYLSNFVLFFKLCVDNYVAKTRKASSVEGLLPRTRPWRSSQGR